MADPSIVVRPLLAVALFAIAPSAQIYIVDAAGGPGTNFLSIAAAVTAVPDGAVIEVRSGTYADFHIQGKSLTIVGEPGVVVSTVALPTISVQGLATNQRVLLRALHFSNPTSTATLACTNSAGAIIIDGCSTDTTNISSGGGIEARFCDQLHIRDSVFVARAQTQLPLRIVQCNTSAVGCDLQGLVTNTILQSGGRLDVCDCSLAGLGAAPVMQLNGGEVVVRGQTRIQGSIFTGIHVLAINGVGTVQFDPNTVLSSVSSPPVAASIATTTPAMPWLRADPGSLGGTSNAVLRGPNSAIAALLVGFPAPPAAVPGIGEISWLAPGSVPLSLGSLPRIDGYAVPNAPWVLGVMVGWHGVTIGPVAVLISNPSVYVHY